MNAHVYPLAYLGLILITTTTTAAAAAAATTTTTTTDATTITATCEFIERNPTCFVD